MRKACFKCGAMKPMDDFYAHPCMRDKHLNKCKACARADVRANRDKRRDYYVAYDRARHGPERVQTIRRSVQRHPERARARIAVHNALKRGKLERRPCAVCGDPQSQGHHDDYAKPLDVRWLCRRHHGEVHRMTS